MGYPIHFSVVQAERRSRLTTFFRLLLVIPHLVVVALFAIGALFVAILGWFAIVFTGRYPRGLFEFQVQFLRYSAQVNCYVYLVSDPFPPFGGGSDPAGYPVWASADYPEQLSRLTTFFRLVLAVPAYIIYGALMIVARIMALLAWFVIVFTGRLPSGMAEVMELPQRYGVRFTAYAYLLITDRYPWFQEESSAQVEQPAPPAEEVGWSPPPAAG